MEDEGKKADMWLQKAVGAGFMHRKVEECEEAYRECIEENQSCTAQALNKIKFNENKKDA